MRPPPNPSVSGRPGGRAWDLGEAGGGGYNWGFERGKAQRKVRYKKKEENQRARVEEGV